MSINLCHECYQKRFRNISEYNIKLYEVVSKKENLLCYHTYMSFLSDKKKI